MVASAIAESLIDGYASAECTFVFCRESTSLQQVVASLQKKHSITLPVCDEDWADIPRTKVRISRDGCFGGGKEGRV